MRTSRHSTGFSLIEVLIVIAIMVMVLGGIFVSFEYALKLIADSRVRTSALSLAADRLEYIRSLPYDLVGTIAGIPAGPVPQTRIVSLNGFNFNERVLIENVDDPGDGLGPLDDNGILADYKKVKIEYEWSLRNASSSLFLVSTIVPRSIETDGGGGTLRVNVFDATVTPLPGILVRLKNDTTTSTIDMSRMTNASGVALFTGAPAAADYEIFVSSPGFTSAQTYQSTTTLPNPATLPVAVLAGDVSTMNFQIDRFSGLDFKLLADQVVASSSIDFPDATGIASLVEAAVVDNSLRLSETGGVYALAGEAIILPLAPSPVLEWGYLNLQAVLPVGTSVRYRFYTSTSTSDIIADTDLPGNSSGFTSTQLSLRQLSASSYPSLVIGLQLNTTDLAVTPQVLALRVSYLESETLRSGATFSWRGAKIIGTLADLTSVPKIDFTATTDGQGRYASSTIEWDDYTLTPPIGQRITEACPGHPLAVVPSATTTASFITETTTTHTLRTEVRTSFGLPVIEATVLLTRPGYTSTRQSSWCGGAFFNGLSEDIDYTLQVSAPGFATSTMGDYSISGEITQAVMLNAL